MSLTRIFVTAAAVGSLVTAALVAASGSAFALEVGTRHATGSSWSRYEGRSRTDSTVNGQVREHSVSGSVGHGFNGSFGSRTLTEDYSSIGRERLSISGGSNGHFSETSTFSR